MKRSPEFLLRRVAGTDIVVPIGAATEKMAGMIYLNGTGVFLWELLENEQSAESLTEALTQAYEVDRETARKDVERFLEKLIPTGAIEGME